jgi:hypothetical protein
MQVERILLTSLLGDLISGERVSNTWIICPSNRDNTPKGVLILGSPKGRMVFGGKEQSDEG